MVSNGKKKKKVLNSGSPLLTGAGLAPVKRRHMTKAGKGNKILKSCCSEICEFYSFTTPTFQVIQKTRLLE